MSTESGYYPPGAEFDTDAPWIKEGTYECVACYNRVTEPFTFCKECHDSAVECAPEL